MIINLPVKLKDSPPPGCRFYLDLSLTGFPSTSPFNSSIRCITAAILSRAFRHPTGHLYNVCNASCMSEDK